MEKRDLVATGVGLFGALNIAYIGYALYKNYKDYKNNSRIINYISNICTNI